MSITILVNTHGTDILEIIGWGIISVLPRPLHRHQPVLRPQRLLRVQVPPVVQVRRPQPRHRQQDKL